MRKYIRGFAGYGQAQKLNFNGSLDEIRLYNRVLTPYEILTLSKHFQVTSENTQTRVITHKF